MSNFRSKLGISLLSFLTAATVSGAPAAEPPTPKSFQTADGATLWADVYPSKNQRATTVILLHQFRQTRASFNYFVPALTNAGFSVINLDMRGNGQSTRGKDGKIWDYRTFQEKDWQLFPSDVDKVIQDLGRIAGVNKSSIAIIGASIGANVAAMNANHPQIKAVVLLSPGANYHQLIPEPEFTASKCPALLYAARGDQYSAGTLDSWRNLRPNSQIVFVDGAMHGSELLKDPGVVNQIVNFLKTETK